MKNTVTYKIALGCVFTLLCYSLFAQNFDTSGKVASNYNEARKRIDSYNKLKKLGYNEKEIYEDLANVNFLIEKYETTVYWYEKLKGLQKNGELNASHQERYQFALKKTGKKSTSHISDDKDWLSAVAMDYKINKNRDTSTGKYGEYTFNPNGASYDLEYFTQNEDIVINDPNSKEYAYKTPATITANGRIAYFNQAVYVKPTYGIFSKKELIHKIFRVEKVNGKWENALEIKLAPKGYSVLHPTVSDDGKRLFFASNMPGTYGKYDIYVSSIQQNGVVGIAKNLGKKINTKKNDLYPTIVNGTSLFFASDGRKGYGGLDLYIAEVGHKKIGLASNLGGHINSKKDDFSIDIISNNGIGYVMSNRGNGIVKRIAFDFNSYRGKKAINKSKYNSIKALDVDSKIYYSTSIFEDK